MSKKQEPTKNQPKKKPKKKGTTLKEAVQYLGRFSTEIDRYAIQNYLGDKDSNKELRYLIYENGKRAQWKKKPDFRKKMIPGIFERIDSKWKLIDRLHKNPAIYRKKVIDSTLALLKDRVEEGSRYERKLTGKTMFAAISKVNIDIPKNARLAVVATVTGDTKKGRDNSSASFVEEFRSLPTGQTKVSMLHSRLAVELNKALHSRAWVFTTHREIVKIHTEETKKLNALFNKYGGTFDDSWSINEAKFHLATLAGYGNDKEKFDRVQSRNVVANALRSSKELGDKRFIQSYKFLCEHYVNENLLEMTQFDEFKNVVLTIAISHIPEQQEG